MPSSRPQEGLVMVLLIAALIWKASCSNLQHTDQSTHHLEGNLSLRPRITHALVETVVDLCIRTSCLLFLSVGQLWILVQSPTCHMARMPPRICNVWAQLPAEHAILLEGRMLSHAGWEASPHTRGVHALNEAIYQESRAQAEAARDLLSDAGLNETVTDMGSYVRIWVSRSPLHICLSYRTASSRLNTYPSWQTCSS